MFGVRMEGNHPRVPEFRTEKDTDQSHHWVLLLSIWAVHGDAEIKSLKCFSSRNPIMQRKAMKYQNDDLDIKLDMIPVKMIRKWKAVTLKRSIKKKNSIEVDKGCLNSLLE